MQPLSARDIVIFGSLGDLAQRKLFPALYQLDRSELLEKDARIIGLARNDIEEEDFFATVKGNLEQFLSAEDLEPEVLERFFSRLGYCRVQFTEPSTYEHLYEILNERGDATRVFYYSTAAAIFGSISKALKDSGCLNDASRVVLEKPLGHDLESSNVVNNQVAEYFSEDRIYRIDHYLGKETVQNLIALRFANPLFGSQWNQGSISHVEITVAEQLGIEGRWGYFDKAGQLRDMVQNHLLQLLCLTAMDPPRDLTADMIRDEKVKVLRSLRPIKYGDHSNTVVRGRYGAGIIDGNRVPGYLEEDGANADSSTETFVAIKAEIDNWRWAGVPFYLRTGKRMPQKLSQIVIYFKRAPHFIFDENQRDLVQNKLVIRLQPEEGISLQILNKDQGLNRGSMRLRRGPLQLNFSQEFEQSRIPEAYERLLLEVIQGNQYLFVRRDEIEHAWRWCDQLLEHWDADSRPPQNYAAGSWGPKAADLMLIKDGNHWHEDELL